MFARVNNSLDKTRNFHGRFTRPLASINHDFPRLKMRKSLAADNRNRDRRHRGRYGGWFQGRKSLTEAFNPGPRSLR